VKEDFYSADARVMRPSAIRAMSKLITRPGIISFAPGYPASDTFPAAEIAEIAARILQDESGAGLQYGLTRGFPPLIEQVAGLMKERGVEAAAEQVLLTSGSQQGLDLLGRVLIDPGDVVLFELPSYIGAIAAFRNYRAELRGILQDQGGVVLERLEEGIRAVRAEGKKLKAFYLIPNFQNPSGVSLAAERRARVLELAERFDFLLIEDDPYGEIYFDAGRRPPPPLSASGAARVIYLSTFSKLLAPALRTAFIVADPELLRRVELAKEATDLCSSGLDQRIVHHYLGSGGFASHCRGLRDFYRVRRDALLDALERYMPAGVRWTRPGGGLFSWVELPQGLDAAELIEPAVAAGVAYVVGQPFHVDGSGKETLRLAYGKEGEARIAEGVEKLAGVIATRGAGSGFSPQA
jgi:2-aminoadipate transaminase